MRKISVEILIAGKNKTAAQMLKRYKADGFLGGYCDFKVHKDGQEKAEIWINSRQNGRQMLDTFFHEMTHLYFRLRSKKRPGKGEMAREERVCIQVGDLATLRILDVLGKCRKCGERINA